MFDVALSSGGAQIALSTSSDDAHPPEHMIDGIRKHAGKRVILKTSSLENQAYSGTTSQQMHDNTFWTTTGMFPQEVVIRFQALMSINRVELCAYNVKNVVIETSENENADNFEPLAERELESMDHQMQQEDMSVGERKAHCLRLLINSGYDHFVCVQKLKVHGRALHG